MEEFAHTSSYWVNDVMRLSAHSWRKVHLDFHNSAHVASIGEDFDPQTFVRKLQESHVAEIVLFAKDMHGFCYFPTASGVQHPGLKFDLLGQQVQGCNAASIKTYAYICALWDEKIAADHPQWCQINRKRETYLPKPDEAPYWTNLCPSNPEVVQSLTNLAREVLEKYAVEGIWFDMVIPREEECFCPNCLAAMSAQGLDPEDNAHQRQYQHELNKQFLKALYDACQAARPGCAVDFNNQPAFGLGERVQWQENIDIEALPTSVWGYDYFPTAVRYVRTQPVAAFGMTGRFHRGWGDFGGFKTPDQLQAEAFAILSHGAGVDIGDQMPPNGVLDDAAYASIGAAFAEVEKLEPYLRDAKPVAEAALLINGNPLDTLVIPSYAGWTKLLTELNIQFDLVDVNGDWSRYPVVIVDSAIVDEELRERLWSCRAMLFYGTNPEGFSYDVRAEKCEFDPSYFTPKYGSARTPVAIYGPSVGFCFPNQSHVQSKADSPFPIRQGEGDCERSELGDGGGTQVIAHQTLPDFQRSPLHYTSHAQSPASHAGNNAIAFVKDKTGFLGFDAGEAYFQTGYPAYRELVRQLLRALPNHSLVRNEAPSTVQIHLARTSNIWIVHVFDSSIGRPSPKHPPYYETANTLANVEVRLSLEGSWSARAVRTGAEVETEEGQGILKLTIPKLRRYEMIVLEPRR